MASSNRHWPSMFKSKPCNHQWQHDINTSSLMSPACQKPPYNSGCEERSPEPKPRWNPRPEQIRILESIFNSGMVNPPRDEIRRIRTRLQEYGQVGDANVFYWFQNRKSRSKHKNRHLQTTTNNRSHSRQTTSAATSSSSSTSSDKSSPDKHPLLPSAAIDVPTNSPTASVNQTNFEQLSAVVEPPFLLQGTAASHGGGYYFSPDYLSNLVQIPEHGLGLCSGLLTELISQGHVGSKKEELKMEVVHPGYPVIANASSVFPTTTNTNTTTTTTTALSDLQGGGGVGEMGGDRVMVFINDVAFEIGVGPINLREAFGDGAVLLHSSGHPVLTDHLGLTIQPLQHGASYYLV